MARQEVIDGDNENAIRELLIGHTITVSDDGEELVLGDGTRLSIHPNTGCGGCSAGNYWVEELGGCDAVITEVTFPDDEGQTECETLTVAVYAAGMTAPKTAISVQGDIGNGYYGRGYVIVVTRPET